MSLDQISMFSLEEPPANPSALQDSEKDWQTLVATWPLNSFQCPDGPRYKSLGNSMAVPVMAWIGKRIQEVSEI